MFKEIFLFELRYRWKRPATWAYFGILFLFGALIGGSGNTPASEKVFINAPGAIAQMVTIISIFGIILGSAIMGVPVYRDIEHKTQNFYFSYPINEKGYILGRFLGSFVILLMISLGLHLGLMLGFTICQVFEIEEASRFGPFNLWHYIQPTLTIMWPNLLLSGALFFALVSLSKRIMLAYAGGALLFVLYLVTSTLGQDIEARELLNILDPFALNTTSNITRYWTPVEQNAQVIPFSGALLYNRLLWSGLAILIFLFTLFRFDFQRFLNKKLGKQKEEVDTKPKLKASEIKIPTVSKNYSNRHNWRQLFQLTKLELKNITRDLFFRSILLIAVAFLFFDAWFGAPIYGTPSLPMTYYMLEVKDFTFIILVFVLIVFITGEVLHRERAVKYDQIYGAMPLPNWVIYGSKFLSLVALCFILVHMILISGVLNQVIKGYFEFELGKYFTDMYLITFPEYIQYVMVAFFVHALVQKKFLGHVITIAIWLLIFGISSFANIDYNMLFYAYRPGYTLSDMNGFGHFGKAQFWFLFYWLSFGGILVILGMLFWKRGTDAGRKARMKTARARLNNYSLFGMGALALAFIGSGVFNYYNVSVLNNYRTNKASRKISVEYEKKYRKYLKLKQPKITDLKLDAEIYPDKRYTVVKGDFTIVNKWDEPIDSLHLNLSTGGSFYQEVKTFTINGQEPVLGLNDEDLGYQIYKLPQTMEPGDTFQMTMEVEGGYRGFPNSGTGSNIVYNGTFFNNQVFPSFGYNAQAELTSDKYRKKNDLPDRDYNSPPQDDPWGLGNLLFNDDGDYVSFEAVIGTKADQIAIAPGRLEKEWEEDGRKYYQYKLDGKQDFFFNISSAAYEVERKTWQARSGETVDLEIFYHPKHDYNIDRIMHAMERSLDYFDQFYTPYQYQQLRILEFPRYATFAQSFPTTVPFAESFGFVGDFSDPEDLDYVFLVTSHEIAHQWWGHQITPSATRGANQISESMAEYSSLMVMKREYGEEAMQDFLKREVDSYLAGRANESKFEKTLLDNDSQAYVWYRKGGSILYMLQDYIGEENLNQGFKNFLDSAAFREEAPFANTLEWYGHIQAQTPDSLAYLLEDSFEKITLYSNRITDATYKKVSDSAFEVTFTFDSEKTYYGGNGEELESPETANLLEIGIFGEDQKNDQGMTEKTPLYLKKQWIKPGQSTLTITVSEEPKKVGIDPYNKMIDRIPNDNMKDAKKVNE